MPSLHRVYFLVHDLIVISLTGRLHALYRPSLLTIPNFGELKLSRQRRAFRNLQQFSLCLFQIHCPKCLLFQLPSTLRDVNCTLSSAQVVGPNYQFSTETRNFRGLHHPHRKILSRQCPYNDLEAQGLS